MRAAMPRDYKAQFSFGHDLTNASCGVTGASRYQLTPTEAEECGVVDLKYFRERFVLCLVRDPLDRLLTMLGTIYKNDIAAMAAECAKARPSASHQTFAYCRPQTDYLYRNSRPVCDLVLADPNRHADLLSVLNVTVLPKQPKDQILALEYQTDAPEIMRFVQSAYRADLADPILRAAVAGRVVFPNTRKQSGIWLPHNPRFNVDPISPHRGAAPIEKPRPGRRQQVAARRAGAMYKPGRGSLPARAAMNIPNVHDVANDEVRRIINAINLEM